MRNITFDTTTNFATTIRNLMEKETLYNEIRKKAKSLKNVPFNSNLKFNKMYEILFYYEMYFLEKKYIDKKDETSRKIYDLLIILDETLTLYEKSNNGLEEINFKFFYSTFLVLLDKLKETMNEGSIKSYKRLFHIAFLNGLKF